MPMQISSDFPDSLSRGFRLMARRLVYSISTGRCGTLFLSNLIRSNLDEAAAVVHHERFGFLNFGVHTPDMSHLTTFNTVGDVPYIREFWNRKLRFDRNEQADVYVEVSHVLSKAGLIENLDQLDDSVEIDIIVLTRSIPDVVWSYVNHFDFVNFGFTWPFTLDPRYPNTILKLRAAQGPSPVGAAHWYVCEMHARAAYYEMLLRDRSQIRFHRIALEDVTRPEGAQRFLEAVFPDHAPAEVNMPGRANQTRHTLYPVEQRATIERICEEADIDPLQAARNFFESGQRLAEPDYAKRPESVAAIARLPQRTG